MPQHIADEKKWDKAKKVYGKEPKNGEDWAQITAIYKKMGGKFEGVEGLLNSFKESMMEIQKPIPEDEADPKELKIGIEVEMEHTNDKEAAKKIALQHLAEVPDYYSKLKKYVEPKESILDRLNKL